MLGRVHNSIQGMTATNLLQNSYKVHTQFIHTIITTICERVGGYNVGFKCWV